MALKDFGKSDNDQGIWFPFGEVEPAFEVRVRRIPNDVAKRLNAQYGKEVFVSKDGVRIPSIERSLDQWTDYLVSQAAWAWSDVREKNEDGTYGGLSIEIADEDAAKLWKGLAKLESQPEIGATIRIGGGLLTDAVKRRIMLQIRPFATVTVTKTDTEGSTTNKREKCDLATFLITKSAEVQTDEVKAEETSRGN